MTCMYTCIYKQSPDATGFFGCVGKDAFGNELKECVKADGVNAFYKEDDEAPTGAFSVSNSFACLCRWII